MKKRKFLGPELRTLMENHENIWKSTENWWQIKFEPGVNFIWVLALKPGFAYKTNEKQRKSNFIWIEFE